METKPTVQLNYKPIVLQCKPTQRQKVKEPYLLSDSVSEFNEVSV